jgi:hypothetical protein
MDFKSDLAQIEADTYDEPPPRNKWEAFWQWLVSKLAILLNNLALLTPLVDVIYLKLLDSRYLYNLLFVFSSVVQHAFLLYVTAYQYNNTSQVIHWLTISLHVPR